MAQATFAERLHRIELQQDMPVENRLLVGLSEEELRRNSEVEIRKASKIVRFVKGFLLMFVSMVLMNRMEDIETLLTSSATTAPYAEYAMGGITVYVLAIFLFFGFKLLRASFGALSSPARLPFALGLVMGFATGLGPAHFLSMVMDKFS